MIEKRSKRRWKKGIPIFVKSIAVTKNWFLVSNFMNFLSIVRKDNVLAMYFQLKTKVKFATFRTF